MIWGSGGSKSRLAKAAGAEPSGQMRDEKVHALVARSTFRSQNVQNTPGSDHFWQLRCRKSARSCGAKHISKSKCTKLHMLAPLLEVEMSKKCTKLWREAHFEVKMLKTLGVRTTFGGSDVVPPTKRERKSKQNVKVLWHFLSTTTITTPHYIPIHYTTTTPSLHSTTLHYTPRHYTTLISTTLHYIPLHSITLHYTTFHYTILHYTTFHYTTLQYTNYNYNYNYNYNNTTCTLRYTTLH